MKFIIITSNSGSKNTPSPELEQLEAVLFNYLKKNPHLKSVKEVSLNLNLCGKAKIKSLNKMYRQKDKVTDVLSFPLYENLRPDKKISDKPFAILPLGDIFVCREVALKQAKEFDLSYEQELLHLVIHGFLHLLGYDHELSPKEEKAMEVVEAELVKKVYKKLGYE